MTALLGHVVIPTKYRRAAFDGRRDMRGCHIERVELNRNTQRGATDDASVDDIEDECEVGRARRTTGRRRFNFPIKARVHRTEATRSRVLRLTSYTYANYNRTAVCLNIN